MYDEVYVKDIMERNGIQKIDILEKMLDYLSSSISSHTDEDGIIHCNVIDFLLDESILI